MGDGWRGIGCHCCWKFCLVIGFMIDLLLDSASDGVWVGYKCLEG